MTRPSIRPLGPADRDAAVTVINYLKVAHALHGRVKKLIYDSPVTGGVVIFDHDPF